MIVQCEKCEAKYNLDDSNITPQGVKVRCAKCQHIFAVTAVSATPAAPPSPGAPPTPPSPPTPPTSEPAEGDFLQDFESFEKFHKDLMDTPGPETGLPLDDESFLERGEFDSISQDTGGVPPSEDVGMAEFPAEEWPGPTREEQRQPESLEEELDTPTFDMRGLEDQDYFERPTTSPKRRKTSKKFVLLGILIILAGVGYYLWSEQKLGLPGDIPALLKAIPEKLKFVPQKLQSVWDDIWGVERGSPTISDLGEYKENIGKVPVFVITGKVLNNTNKTKKHVQIKAILYNDKNEILDEKQTKCGSYFTREELKNLPPRFARGDFRIRPPAPNQMRVAPGMTIPFIVIFPNISPDVREYEVEIVDAPNA